MKTFISHATQDFSQVRLLVHLLHRYNVETWCCLFDLKAGASVKTTVINSLLKSDKLLVIVTPRACGSCWVTLEIATFENLKSGCEIIPLIFEHTDLEKISPGLSSYPGIDFTTNFITGFQKLFEKFNIEFPESPDRRDVNERRRIPNRRRNGDRRCKDIAERLNLSLWKSYSQNNRLTEDEYVSLTDYELNLFLESIRQEARKFLCYDEHGNLYNMEYIVHLYANHLWTYFKTNLCDTQNPGVRAKYIPYFLAKKLTHEYIIKCEDRRKKKDRREGLNRRSSDDSFISPWSRN
ncbi:MAG TPA: toll/interleukin-1 receptor domain-containing protein [bacterium]